MISDDQLVNFVNNLTDFGLEYFGKFYGLYRGIVTKNKDNENLGRIKVKVPSVFGDKELFEWAWPIFGFAGKGYGEFCVPEENDGVMVCFEFGDIKHPIYLGGWYGKNELSNEFKHKEDESPHSKGIITKAGNKIVISDEKGKENIKIKHKSGNTIEMDENIKIKHKNGSDIIVDSEINISHKSGSEIRIDNKGMIFLGGKGVFQSLVKGQILQAWLQSHTHLDSMGKPTSPSIVPVPPNMVSLNVKTS